MSGFLRNSFRRALSPELRQQAKRRWRQVLSVTLGRELSLGEFRHVLEDRLGIRRNSTVLVHCSFGRLKAGFSPDEAVQVLKDVVGPGGNIMMPCYPGNGQEWLESGSIFDGRSTPILTGALAQQFSRSSGVTMSNHPIKAVAAWGKDRDFLVRDHHLSRTPYDENSPYAKLLHLPGSLVVGLGTAKMSFFHCCEDSVPCYAERLYTAEPLSGFCRTPDGEVMEVRTYVHLTDVLSGMPSSVEFLTRTRCPSYNVFSYRGRLFYVGDVKQVYDHVHNVIASDENKVERTTES